MANTTTNTAAVIEKIVSSLVQETLQQNSIAIGLVQNRTSEVRPGMDRIDIARFDAPTVATHVEGVADTEFNSTIVTEKLTLDINESVHWGISDRSNVQDKVNVIAQVTRDAAVAMAAAVDNAIIANLLDCSTAAPDHVIALAGANLAQADILDARLLLNTQNVMMNDRFILVNPTEEAALLAIPDFIRADQYGRTPSALMNGELGTLYGMPVFMSTSPNLVAVKSRTCIFQRSHVAYASQITSRFDQDRDIARLTDLFSLSMLYGTIVLDESGGATGGVRGVQINADGLV